MQCDLGLFGGRPYIALCAKCARRVAPQDDPSGALQIASSPVVAEDDEAGGLDSIQQGTDETSAAIASSAASARRRQRKTKMRADRSQAIDRHDDQQARWGRQRDEGFRVGRFLQPAPLLFTADHHPLWLGDMYRGRSAFLVCGGPSFKLVDHARLRQPGILTMGLNNSAKTFRPTLWVSVDSPDHFLRSVWLDPTILKFAPICHTGKRLFDSDSWRWMTTTVRDCPSVFYYKRNEHFQAKQFLWEDTINWGNHTRFGGGRSVMLPAIRLLFYLGVRCIYLLGADFSMDSQHRYHFEQDRAHGAISGNNDTYRKLNVWFKELRELFEAEQFFIFNCNGESRLEAFDFVSVDAAMTRVSSEWGHIDLARERTAGLYDSEKGKP